MDILNNGLSAEPMDLSGDGDVDEDSSSPQMNESIEPSERNEEMQTQEPFEITLEEKGSFHSKLPNIPELECRIFQAKVSVDANDKTNVSNTTLDLDNGNNLNGEMHGDSIDRKKKAILNKNVLSSLLKLFGGPVSSPPPPPPKPKSKLKFEDCGGLEKQIRFIQTALIGPLRKEKSSEYSRFGLEPPKGILFYGPPGTGKTRLAQAISNEISQRLGRSVHFIYRKGQDIASKWFGQSSENLRAVFQEATLMQPTVLFFDELDGLCPSRDLPHMNQANVTIVTTMLGLMDDLPKGKVFVIGATNRLNAVDPALRRPGRFDKYLEFFSPDTKGRFDILKIHTRGWKIRPSSDVLKSLSANTVGFSGADLAKLCMDAFDNALCRLIEGDSVFSQTDFSKLLVGETDWNQALSKIKPSNSAVFGSNAYQATTPLVAHLEPLLGASVESIVKRIQAALEKACSGDRGKINALYIFSKCKNVLGSLDDLLLGPALRSEKFGSIPIYKFTSVSLSTVAKKLWAQKITTAFTQALEAPPPAILYIKDVDELSNVISLGQFGFILNIKQMLEKLRGKSVLLLGSGSTHPDALVGTNPFRKLLLSNPDIITEIKTPTENDRSNFFEQVLAEAVMLSGNWQDEDLNSLLEIQNELVECTKNSEIDSVVFLHDRLKDALSSPNPSARNNKALIKKFWEIIGVYKAP